MLLKGKWEGREKKVRHVVGEKKHTHKQKNSATIDSDVKTVLPEGREENVMEVCNWGRNSIPVSLPSFLYVNILTWLSIISLQNLLKNIYIDCYVLCMPESVSTYAFVPL